MSDGAYSGYYDYGSYGYDESAYGYGGYGYSNYFGNPLYIELYGPGEYRSNQTHVGTVYYSGYAYENYYYGKSYSASYYNSADGYYKNNSGYINSVDNLFKSETINAYGSYFYEARYTHDYSGNPFEGFSGSYEHFEAADGSSVVYTYSRYETFGLNTPSSYTTSYETTYTNSYGYSYYISGGITSTR